MQRHSENKDKDFDTLQVFGPEEGHESDQRARTLLL